MNLFFKKIKYHFIIPIGFMAILSCDSTNDFEGEILNWVVFERNTTITVDPGGSAEQTIKVYTSKIYDTDRVFNLIVDSDNTTANPDAYTIPASVTVPANSNSGSFNVSVLGENVDPEGEDILAITITSDTEEDLISEPIELRLEQVCPHPELLLNITFDSSPWDIYWRLLDSNYDTLFQSSSNWGYYEGRTGSVVETFCLPSGTYWFQMFDAYQNGAGPFEITYDGEVLFSSDGAYGYSSTSKLVLD